MLKRQRSRMILTVEEVCVVEEYEVVEEVEKSNGGSGRRGKAVK